MGQGRKRHGEKGGTTAVEQQQKLYILKNIYREKLNKLYANKIQQLMNKILERQKLPKLIQEEKDKLNGPIFIKDTAS